MARARIGGNRIGAAAPDMERMTPKDAAILALEDDVAAAHGMTIGIFEGPEPPFDDLHDLVADRVRLIPRYRQRIVEVPFDIERPVWADDPNFSIDFHLRHTALPARERRDALSTFVSRALSQRLDRGKPLWEMWMVSGLSKKRWALVSKAHYAIIDGVSGTDLLGLLADSIEADDTVGMRMPSPLPTSSQLTRDALIDLAFDPLEIYRATRGLVKRPFHLARAIGSGLVGGPAPSGLGRAAGPHRRWVSAHTTLDELRAIRERHACSTTDVILAAFAGGIRNYLVVNGKPLPLDVKAVVPLAVGAASGGVAGQVSTLTTMLPIAEADPAIRLAAIHKQTSAGAVSRGAIAGQVLRRQENFVAPSILAQGVRSTMLQARNDSDIDTVAINVPGPHESITILGYEMVEAYPVIPLPGRVQIAMAAMSLRDDVYFGITSDWDTTSGLRYAAAGVTAALEEL